MSGPTNALAIHDRYGSWTLMAVIDAGRPMAVVERAGVRDGMIAYLDDEGVVAEFSTTGEPTAAPADVRASEFGNRDVLRDLALSGSRDPRLDDIASLIPPIRRLRDGQGERPHTFVGSPDSLDVVPIYYDSLRATSRVNPSVVAPEIRAVIEEQRIVEGLVGGWLPAVRFMYETTADDLWESVTFAPPAAASLFSQPVWYRYLHVVEGRVVQARYIDSYLPYPVGEPARAERFYEALLELHSYWADRLTGGMSIETPEPWIDDFCRHSFVQEMITRVGDHPRYGVVDRIYGAAEHDGFQDTLNVSVAAYLEWGHPAVAARYLDDYFGTFVREDGTIDYRGPELGQYARMLTTVARYVTMTGDVGMIARHRTKIHAIVALLLDRRSAAAALDSEDPAHGLIHGRHEADISFDTPTLGTMDYERPYFSNSAEAVRGLRDLGRVFDRAEGPDAALGTVMLDAAETLLADLGRGIDRSWVVRGGQRELPLYAGSPLLHTDAPYRETPASYDENRVWGELLHSGMLDADLVDHVVESGARHGDSMLGIFGNRKLLVSFTAYGVGYGLLQHDRIREFLMLYYAHAAHLHTRGTWTVLECADPDRDRAEHWPYCLPGQLTIPHLTKWMLVFEDPITDELWLAKAAPRAWLADGERIAVIDAPTAHGSVGFTIESHPEADRVEATVSLAVARPTAVHLRLRCPDRKRIASVTVDGREWAGFDPLAETVSLPAGTVGTARVVALLS